MLESKERVRRTCILAELSSEAFRCALGVQNHGSRALGSCKDLQLRDDQHTSPLPLDSTPQSPSVDSKCIRLCYLKNQKSMISQLQGRCAYFRASCSSRGYARNSSSRTCAVPSPRHRMDGHCGVKEKQGRNLKSVERIYSGLGMGEEGVIP